MDKLLLIQPLKLEDEDIIHLLIDGIKHLSIKSAVATLRADSVDQFLDEMHNITTICDSSLKKNHSTLTKTKTTPSSIKGSLPLKVIPIQMERITHKNKSFSAYTVATKDT